MVKNRHSKKYRKNLAEQIKMLGQEVIDRAEDLVGNGDMICDFEIKLIFPQNAPAELIRTTSFLSKRQLDSMCDGGDGRGEGQIKWNYISEVGLPSSNYDWVLVKTDFMDSDSVPYICELRNGKWHSSEFGALPIEDVLDCRVIAWADMQLIK